VHEDLLFWQPLDGRMTGKDKYAIKQVLHSKLTLHGFVLVSADGNAVMTDQE
jgi:hypothetical protein